jgi:hypothetical protein
MNIKSLQIVVLCALFAALVTGCGPAAGSKPQPAKVTTRWKWTPKPVIGNIAIATPEGIVIEQTGEKIEAGFFLLKEGAGFVVEKKVSQGKYFADKQRLVLPIGPINPNEFDQYLALDIYRMEVSLKDFNPQMSVLKVKWAGNGPQREEEFVRVQD